VESGQRLALKHSVRGLVHFIQLIWPVFPCNSGVPFPSVSTTGSLLQAAFRSASICSCRERVQGA